MSKFRLKVIIIRVLLGTYRGIGYFFKYTFVFLVWIKRQLAGVVKILLFPLIKLIYGLGFVGRVRLERITEPVRTRLFYLFGHRHAIHFAVITIVFVTSVLSISTRAVRAEELGTKSILFALVSNSDNELIEEGTSPQHNYTSVDYLVDAVSISYTPDIDYDYTDSGHVSSITGGSAITAPTGTHLSPSTASRTGLTTYVVKEGDTISSIADEFSISIETVLNANNLTVRSYIRPGDQLTVLPLDGLIYTIKKGDTLEKIAKTYGASTQDIHAWNSSINETALALGTQLLLPGGQLPEVARATTPTRQVSSASTIFTGPKPSPATNIPPGAHMIWPTTVHRITQYYTWKHTGVDVAGPVGTPIFAVDDGIVVFSGWTNGYGNNIMIDHGNGLRTRYAHASKLYLKKGDHVNKGDVIEAMGSTGRSTGPHLHFEVIKGTGRNFLNPLDFVSYK